MNSVPEGGLTIGATGTVCFASHTDAAPPIVPFVPTIEVVEAADAGFVTWDIRPPAGVSAQAHQLTFLEAVVLGLNFCRTDMRDEWMVLGANALTIVRSLPQYVYAEPTLCGEFVRIGTLQSVVVYILARTARKGPIEPDSFWVGVREVACRGRISNYQSIR